MLVSVLNQHEAIAQNAIEHAENVTKFQKSNIYQSIADTLDQYDIKCLCPDAVSHINRHCQYQLARKIFVSNDVYANINNKYLIQFPILLHSHDISKLHLLNLYATFPKQQVLIQYFYRDIRIDSGNNNKRYQITETFSLNTWFEVIHLRPFRFCILIKNTGGNGYVARGKIESVVLTEMRKSESLKFEIFEMANHVARHRRLSLIVSLEIHHKHKEKHFGVILNEMNRHLTNNFNDSKSRYLVRIHTPIRYESGFVGESLLNVVLVIRPSSSRPNR